MATLAATGNFGIDLDQVDIGILLFGLLRIANSTTYAVDVDGEITSFLGSGLKYDASYTPIGGVVNRITDSYLGQAVFDITGLNTPATQFVVWALSGDNSAMKQTLLAGADLFTGSSFDDLLRGYDGSDTIVGGLGNDSLDGGAGADSITAGAGNDVVVDASGANYLRGDDGNDIIRGGAEFDDINGNVGNDTAFGGPGDDWVVGGKDNDSLSGDAGADLVYGNLGNDTCDGGEGDDIVRGGQDNDVVIGGAGNDFVSGDKGSDTMTGGAGADIFHSFGDAGIDRVTDFHVAEGDRVMLDPGTQYSVSQIGSDTVINMVGGGQMVLVGVTMSSLSGTWIFGA
ncbi:MAG: calcium-binding protein [Caulobacterales bacterium]|nr:calcium-binding protein [Caulobacterales bacterium]